MIYRILYLFINSFKSLYREKVNFYASSFTICICLILISLIGVISLGAIKKIKSIDMPELIVTYKDLNENFQDCSDLCVYTDEQCPECDFYDPLLLEDIKKYKNKNGQIVEEKWYDKKGKEKCKNCLDKLYFKSKDKFYSFNCEEDCTPYKDSNYLKYYGSKKNSNCGECLDRQCDEANNTILTEIYNLDFSKPIYKENALKIWEDLMGINYFFGRHREKNDLPMQGVFVISDEINSRESLNRLINNIKAYPFVEKINDSDMIDIENFIFYKKLINIIVGSVLIIVFMTLLIPFFIVSNTIHLIIHSKKDILNTLRILGEKDYYIKLPFIFQGIWQGIIGGFLAISFIGFLDMIELGHIVNDFFNITIPSKETLNLNLVYNFKHAIIILFLGIFLGIFGALRSVSKYLK